MVLDIMVVFAVPLKGLLEEEVWEGFGLRLLRFRRKYGWIQDLYEPQKSVTLC